MTDVDSIKEGAPPKEFFITSMPLKDLRALAGVSTRQLEERKKANPQAGYQRAHEPERSEKIARYVSYGYPLSSQKGLDPQTNTQFIHPGWLPTAILINIIPAGESRRRHGKDLAVSPELAILLKNDGGHYSLDYPDPASFNGKEWDRTLQPVEVIDGGSMPFPVELDFNKGPGSVPIRVNVT